MPPGFLAVFAEPGEQVSLDEFHDWYDNEHIPLRLNHLPAFLTCARFSATDARTPSWLALYDVTDPAAFGDPAYVGLREQRSEREASVVGRLGMLDRRACVGVWEGVREGEGRGVVMGLGVGGLTRGVVTQEVVVGGGGDGGDGVVERWAGEVAGGLRGVDGWVRSRVFRLLDGVRTGTAVGEGEGEGLSEYLVVHEMLSPAVADTPAFQTVVQKGASGLGVKVVEDRRWELYRAYPSIAQGNVPVGCGS